MKISNNNIIFFTELLEKVKEFEKRQKEKEALMAELNKNNIKFSQEDILEISLDSKGKIIFLERGNEKAGYKHLISGMRKFENSGIPMSKLPQVLVNTLKNEKPIGIQGVHNRKGGRPIYPCFYQHANNKPIDLAITVGNNGFIVSANPVRKTIR